VIEVVLDERDNLDRALRRFRRQLLRSGLLQDMKRKRFYLKPSEARKLKAEAARRRVRKARRRGGRP
jgi:small subunit ribosomal protein S21